VIFDPRPLKFRTHCPQRLEELRGNLLKVEKLPNFLNVILSSADKIQHEHCYCVTNEVSDVDPNGNEECGNDTVATVPPNQLVIPAVSIEQNILEKLILTVEERESLELCTRQQSECDKWHDVHCLRITGSKCGPFYCRRKGLLHYFSFVYILRSCCTCQNLLHGVSVMRTRQNKSMSRSWEKMAIMALKLLGQICSTSTKTLAWSFIGCMGN